MVALLWRQRNACLELEDGGFDLHAIEDAGAAWLLGQRGGGNVESEKSVLPSGYQKLTASTMKYLNLLLFPSYPTQSHLLY